MLKQYILHKRLCILALKGRNKIDRGERSVAPVYMNHPPSQSREAVTEKKQLSMVKKYAQTFVFFSPLGDKYL